MKKILMLTGVLVGTLVLSACSQPERPSQGSEAVPALDATALVDDPATSEMFGSPMPESEQDESDSSQVRTIQVEAGSFYYEPSEIRVKKGETVRIEMSSVDMMHDFVIAELDVNLPITKAGETNIVEFTANQVGEFQYFCSVGSHREQGQVGTLIVEE